MRSTVMQHYCHNGLFQKCKQPASPASSSLSSSGSFPALDVSTEAAPVPVPVPVPPKPKAVSKGKLKQPQAKRICEEATSVAATISPLMLDAHITSKVGQMMDECLAPLLQFLKQRASPEKAGPPPKAVTPPRPTATVRISPLRASESDGGKPVIAMSFSDEEDTSMEAAKQLSHQAAVRVTGEM